MARKSSSDIVHDVLQGYADRGIFRGFGFHKNRSGKNEFRFLWLASTPFVLIHDPKSATLRFKDLLPNIPARSAMYAQFKEFIRGRCLDEVPEHRRVDRRYTEVKCSNRKGSVSLELKVKRGRHEYTARKAIKLVNEIFMNFLAGPYYEYMVENFEASEE